MSKKEQMRGGDSDCDQLVSDDKNINTCLFFFLPRVFSDSSEPAVLCHPAARPGGHGEGNEAAPPSVQH